MKPFGKTHIVLLLIAIFILLALFILFTDTVSAQCTMTPEGLRCDQTTVCNCYPGFPSGWFNKNCYGENGGWKMIEQGCSCGSISKPAF